MGEPTQRRIVNLVTSRRCSNAVQVRSYLKANENLEISEATIRRILRSHGLVSGVKRKKPYLSKYSQKNGTNLQKNMKIGPSKTGQR